MGQQQGRVGGTALAGASGETVQPGRGRVGTARPGHGGRRREAIARNAEAACNIFTHHGKQAAVNIQGNVSPRQKHIQLSLIIAHIQPPPLLVSLLQLSATC